MHLLIDSWQPKLNCPVIGVPLQRTASGFRANTKVRRNSYSKFGRRLWIKLRKKLYPSHRPYKFGVSRQKAWNMLEGPASFTKQSFEASKEIRSQRWLPSEVHVLTRLSNNLQEPSRSKVRQFFQISVSATQHDFSSAFCDGPETQGLEYQGFLNFNLRPEASFCHVLGELCPCLYLTLLAFICHFYFDHLS